MGTYIRFEATLNGDTKGFFTANDAYSWCRDWNKVERITEDFSTKPITELSRIKMSDTISKPVVVEPCPDGMKRVIITPKCIFEVVQSEDGKLQLFDNSQADRKPVNKDFAAQFIYNIGGVIATLARCIFTDKTVEAIAEEEKQYKINYRKEKIERQSKILNECLAKLKQPSLSKEEIYELFLEANSIDTGWGLTERVFILDNALSNDIASKIGSYTATPYDNGEVIIKSKIGRWSNHRRAKSGSLHDLIFEDKVYLK